MFRGWECGATTVAWIRPTSRSSNDDSEDPTTLLFVGRSNIVHEFRQHAKPYRLVALAPASRRIPRKLERSYRSYRTCRFGGSGSIRFPEWPQRPSRRGTNSIGERRSATSRPSRDRFWGGTTNLIDAESRCLSNKAEIDSVHDAYLPRHRQRLVPPRIHRAHRKLSWLRTDFGLCRSLSC